MFLFVLFDQDDGTLSTNYFFKLASSPLEAMVYFQVKTVHIRVKKTKTDVCKNE